MDVQNWKNEHPQYISSQLSDDVPRTPWPLWEKWQKDAKIKKKYTNEIALSTCAVQDDICVPSIRMVLLKYCSEDKGFCWYSKQESEKGKHLAKNPFAEILWYDNIFQRQVRVRGKVILLPEEDALEYARSRPRPSQLSALISKQSYPISSRDELEKKYSEAEKKYKDNIPVADDWCGYCLEPQRFEFWQGRKDRLHDRICFEKKDLAWSITRLQP